MQIPWWHNVVIVSKCQSTEEATYYVHHTLHHGWLRAVLIHQIESNLYERQGKALTNFDRALPASQSD
jgi:predicted nuclease of restriction endonuclease-like (RecB) superfamily